MIAKAWGKLEIPNGLINLDSEFADHYGFTSEYFYEVTYLIGDPSLRQVIIPMLISNFPGEGHFSEAVKKLLYDGIRVSIPTPVPLMQKILTAWGFEIIWNSQEGIEYWIYPPYNAKEN